jgi:hypothetical protein
MTYELLGGLLILCYETLCAYDKFSVLHDFESSSSAGDPTHVSNHRTPSALDSSDL